MTEQMTAAAALLADFKAAHAKFKRNLNTCTFISLTRREEDPFVVYADKLARMEAKKNEAQAAWADAALALSTEELVEVMQAA